ncbi:MAG: Spi family protease inhibitor [Bacteroidales bacterium]|nr:Spi family protease inhibitor [Bacteroidales bacterium]
MKNIFFKVWYFIRSSTCLSNCGNQCGFIEANKPNSIVKITKSVILIAFSILISNCNKVETYPDVESPLLINKNVFSTVLTKSESIALRIAQNGTYKISPEKAISMVREELKDENICFKSCLLRKTNKDKIGYYEITFSGSKGDGYSIVSADERIPEIICFVEKGSLSDTINIEPLKYYMRAIPLYIEESIKDYKNLDSLRASAISKLQSNIPATKNIPHFDPNVWSLYGTYIDSTCVKIEHNTPSWSQTGPLGNNINYSWGICGVVAVAEVMAYHKVTYINTLTYDYNLWLDMLNGDEDSLACLGADIFHDIYWLFNLVAPLPSTICSFFNNNGYSASSQSGYNYYDLMDYIVDDGPAILLGFEGPIIPEVWSITEGHYWVADGIDYKLFSPYDVYYLIYNGNILYHYVYYDNYSFNKVYLNWGWGVSSNGWFTSGVFELGLGHYEYSMSLIDIA